MLEIHRVSDSLAQEPRQCSRDRGALARATCWLFALLLASASCLLATAVEASATPPLVIRLVYDADGQRVGRETIAWDATESRWRTNRLRYLVDSQHPSGYAQRLADREIGEGGSTQRVFLLGLQPVASQEREGVQYRLLDGHSSARANFGTNGYQEEVQPYDAFGNSCVGFEGAHPFVSSGPDDIGYSGEFYDPTLGLQELRARYYDPGTGRFRTMDSEQRWRDLPTAVHKYLYASADPVNRIDPSGHLDILSVTVDQAIRGGIAGLTFGSISAGFAYAKGATAGAAIWDGLKVAALTEFAFVSPLAAVSFGGAGIAGVGLGIYSGEFTADDLPEVAAYMAVGLVLRTAFSSGTALEGAHFAQTSYRSAFSKRGALELSKLLGVPIKTIDDLVEAIKRGAVKPNTIPVHYIIRNGRAVILNTRTSVALEKAGVPRSRWKAVDVTGDELFEGLLNDQLKLNGLGERGSPTVSPQDHP